MDFYEILKQMLQNFKEIRKKYINYVLTWSVIVDWILSNQLPNRFLKSSFHLHSRGHIQRHYYHSAYLFYIYLCHHDIVMCALLIYCICILIIWILIHAGVHGFSYDSEALNSELICELFCWHNRLLITFNSFHISRPLNLMLTIKKSYVTTTSSSILQHLK